jgi:hypothetical protein
MTPYREIFVRIDEKVFAILTPRGRRHHHRGRPAALEPLPFLPGADTVAWVRHQERNSGTVAGNELATIRDSG